MNLKKTFGSKKATKILLFILGVLLITLFAFPDNKELEPEPEYIVSYLTITKLHHRIDRLERKVKKLETYCKKAGNLLQKQS